MIAGFTLTVAPILLAPGTSTLLVSAEALRDRSGVPRVVAGDLTANAVQMALVGVLLASLGELHHGELVGGLRWLGVGYLWWLAMQRLRSAGAEWAVPPKPRLFLRGFLVSATNPKALIFFAGLFPAFLDLSVALLPQLVQLGVVYLLLDGLCLGLYALVAERLREVWARRPDTLDRGAAGCLLLAGLILALK